MNIRLTLLLGSVLLTLGLVGCSSSSSDGGPDTGPSGGGVTGSATGTVADGIIKQGQVVVNELDASGNVIRVVGNATTDNKGQYTVTIGSSYGGGPLQFLLTGDANTTMVCDVQAGCGTRNDTLDSNGNGTVDYGEVMSVDGLSMEALVGHANAGDKLSVSITPFTTAAANRARSTGTVDQTSVDEANSAISNLFGGIDIIGQTPVDLTSSAQLDAASTNEGQITYSALVSAIGKLAFNGGNASVGDIQSAITKLNNAVQNSDIGAVTAGAGAFSLQDIVDAAKGQFPPGRSDQTGTLNAIQTKIDLAINTGTGTVGIMPNSNVGNTDVEKAKGLVGEIRTWGITLDSQGSAVDSFYNRVKNADSVGDFRQFSSLSAAVNIATSIALDNISAPGSYDYDGSNFGTSGQGKVTFSLSGNTFTVNITGTVLDNTVDLDMTFPAPGNAATSMSATLSGTVASTDSGAPGASLVVNSGTFDVTFSSALDPFTLSQGQFESSFDTAGLSLDLTFTQTNVVNPVMYSGTADVSVGAFRSGPFTALLPTAINLDGTVTDAGDSFHMTLDGTLNNPSSYDPFSPQSATNAWDATVDVGVTLDLSGLPQAQLTVSLHHTGYIPDTNTILGNASLVLTHGGNTLNGTVSQDSNDTLSQITFTDTAGAALVVDYTGGTATGALTVGSATVGSVISLNSNVIKVSYSDGTFETLN